jgi:hypothetical protein
MTHLLLAYRPFLDPISFDRYWYLLLLPMAFFLAVGYKAVRTVDMAKYWRQVFSFTAQLVLGLLALGLGFFLVIRVLLPIIAPLDR